MSLTRFDMATSLVLFDVGDLPNAILERGLRGRGTQ